MFSDTYTGTCCLPLCTAIVRPMKSGMIVERRDQVLIGFLSLVACAVSTFLTRWASQNGPFFNERVMCYPLFLAATRDNHRRRTLVATRLLAFGLLAPWRYRMTACSSTAFAATVRVVNRIHHHTTHRRTDATPAHCTGLADLAQVVFAIAHFADCRAAFDVHAAHFTGTQTDLSVCAFTRHQHDTRTGSTRHLRALARQHLYAMHRGADRDIANRQAVARLDRRFRAIHQLVTNGDALRRDDVLTLAIGIAQQCDMRGAVRIVFDTLDLGGDAILVATKIDDAIVLLVTTTDVTGGDVAVVVTAGSFRFLLDQTGERTAFVQVGIDDLDHAAAAGRGRLHFNECHY